MTETTEPQLSEQDLADLESLSEAELKYSLLRIWSELLSNVETSAKQRLPMATAVAIVRKWGFLNIHDTASYHDYYHDYLGDMAALFFELVKDHPDRVDVAPADDLETNYDLYKQLVIDWNIRLDELERSWDVRHPDSHVQLAALADVRQFIFASDGMAGHLEVLGFEVDPQEIADAVLAAREVSGE